MNNEFIRNKFFIGNLRFKVQDGKVIGQFMSCLAILSKSSFKQYGQKEVTPYQLWSLNSSDFSRTAKNIFHIFVVISPNKKNKADKKEKNY